MIRREQQADGSVVVWTERIVSLHGPDGELLESRPLTEEERAEFVTWADAQPGGDMWRAMREAAGVLPTTSEPTTVSEPDPGTYRSAVTGEFVTAAYAAEHPDTTVRVDLETVQALRAENAELKARLGEN